MWITYLHKDKMGCIVEVMERRNHNRKGVSTQQQVSAGQCKEPKNSGNFHALLIAANTMTQTAITQEIEEMLIDFASLWNDVTTSDLQGIAAVKAREIISLIQGQLTY